MSPAPGDARSSWTVDVVDLLRQPGDRRHLELAAPVPDLAVAATAVPEGSEVRLEVDLEALNGVEVVAIGRVAAPWRGACRRCLEDVTGVGHTTRVIGDAPSTGVFVHLPDDART